MRLRLPLKPFHSGAFERKSARALFLLVLLSAAILGNGSGRSGLMAAEPPKQFDLAKMDAAIELRIEKIFARPAVDKAMDSFVDAVIADPALQKGGSHLLEQVGADPKITEAVDAIETKLGESPAMQDLVKELMRDNPDKSAGDIGAMAGARFEKAFDSPAVSKGIQSSFEALVGKIDVDWQKSGIVGDMTKRLEECFADPSRLATWDKRLTALNAGQMPSPSQAVELYIDNAWSEERTEKFLLALQANHTFRSETAQFLAEALEIDAVASELRTSAGEIICDKDVQSSINKLLLQIMAKKQDEKAIKAELDRLLTAPKIVKSAKRLAEAFLNNERVQNLARKHIKHLAEDPEVAKLCTDFIDKW